MKIQITKDYRISSDEYCYKVEKYAGVNKDTGKQVWAAKTYHRDFEQAVRALISRLCRTSDATTMAELRETAKSVREAVESGLKHKIEAVA